MKNKVKPLVQLKPKGKVSVAILAIDKALIVSLLERELNSGECITVGGQLVRFLSDELYTKHLVEFTVYRDTKLLLSRAHAYALWFILQQHKLTPTLGNLKMQLHQKLS